MHAAVSEPLDNMMETAEVATADDEITPGDSTFSLLPGEEMVSSHNYAEPCLSRLESPSLSERQGLVDDYERISSGNLSQVDAPQDVLEGSYETSNIEGLKLEQDSHLSNLDSDRSDSPFKCAKIPRLSETPSPAASLPVSIDISGCNVGGAASWHPHVYARPPRAPTPHFIADILGWGKESKNRTINEDVVSLETSEPLNLSVAKSCSTKSRILLKKGEFLKIS